jgi:hypothetical protein
MSFTAGCAVFNAIVGILTVVAVHRIGSWDDGFKRSYNATDCRCRDANSGNVRAVTSVIGKLSKMPEDKADEMLSDLFFHYMADGKNSPLGFGMLCFPWSIVTYFVAVILKSTAEASLFLQVAAPIICAMWVAPLAYYGHRVVFNIITN